MKNKAILAAMAVLYMTSFQWSQKGAGQIALAYRHSITVTSPAAGERWCTASSLAISWRAPGVAGPLRIDLIRAGDDRNAASVMEIAASTANNGSFPWYIPSSLAAGEYKVRVRSVSGSPVDYGESAVFSARACPSPAISVTAPTAGESWCLSNRYWIRWTSRDVSGLLAIELRPVGATGGSVRTLVNNVDDTGSFHCLLSESWVWNQDGDYKIRVRTVSDTPLVYGDSPTIRVSICMEEGRPRRLTVTTPESSNRWMVGSRQEIRWKAPLMDARNSSLGIAPPVSITLLGDHYREIAARANNNGLFAWSVPLDLPAGHYRIRVQQLDTEALEGTSPQFVIEPFRSGQVKPADRNGMDPQVAANLAKLRYWIRFSGSGPSPSPQFGIPEFQKSLGAFSGRVSLLKDGREVKVLAAFGAGKTLPDVLTCRLSQQDGAALKENSARFTLGIFDSRGKLVQEVARQEAPR